MKKEIGLWIDRREAIIVILTEGEEAIRHISSSSEAYTREAGNSHAMNPEGLLGFTVEDQRDRKYANQLNKYYDEVISVIHDADSIQIFGPGRQKASWKNASGGTDSSKPGCQPRKPQTR